MDGYKWKDIFSVGLPGLYFACLSVLIYCMVFKHDIADFQYVRIDVFAIMFPLVIILIGCLLNFWSSAIEKSLKVDSKKAKEIFEDKSLHHLTDSAMELLKKKANPDCCDLKEEQQMTSARHYVAEAMILLDNHDILDEYYVRKVICRNIFLVHSLIVIMTILFMSWSWVFLKGSLAFECADIFKIVLFLIYCVFNARMFYRLWNRFTKRYIQVQLFCFQTLVDGKKIS